MTTMHSVHRVPTGHHLHRTDNTIGTMAAILGAVGLAALVWAWLVSTSLDPPAWVRAPGLLLLPVGMIGSLACGSVGMLNTPRRWAATGLGLGVVTVVGFVVLMLADG